LGCASAKESERRASDPRWIEILMVAEGGWVILWDPEELGDRAREQKPFRTDAEKG
jgi:hypothetical protein